MSVLVVAFDGLDHDLIEDFGCESIKQSEFGRIDNETRIFRRMTSELFVSFLTGETWEVHGVRDLTKWENPRLDRLEKYLSNFYIFRKFSGLRSKFWNVLGFHKRGYIREDYSQETLFDKIPDSIDIAVPGYSLPLQQGQGLLSEYGLEAAVNQQQAMFEYKRMKLMDAIEEEPEFLMVHFHKADHFHHWFWEIGKEERVKDVYTEFNELAKTIKKEAGQRFDLILFMSDHGLPDGPQHNENAFYSSNLKLGLKEPHITDFHDIILERVGAEETSGLDI